MSRESLRKALSEINEALYGVGAPMGSKEYFVLRGMVVDAILADEKEQHAEQLAREKGAAVDAKMCRHALYAVEETAGQPVPSTVIQPLNIPMPKGALIKPDRVLPESVVTRTYSVPACRIESFVPGPGDVAVVKGGGLHCMEIGAPLYAEQSAVPREWITAVQEFVDRCEKGEIRSERTYRQFKQLLQSIGED